MKKTRIPRPFLKWVGGKTQLLQYLTEMIPESTGIYHEPFVGGGALFFELAPNRAVLSDLNQELIDCYRAVRDSVEEVIEILKTHRYEKEHFYQVRAVDPWQLSLTERAARMIYLNRTGFNGLYRVNSKGEFNVPFGRYTNPTICDEPNLRACSRRLQGVELLCEPFEAVLTRAKSGDLVYFDPPYIPVSNTSNFTAYEKSGFGMDSQEHLAEIFDELAERGVFAMLSNADVPWMRSRYEEHYLRPIKAARNVNSKADKRGPVSELIVTNYQIVKL